MFNRYVPNRKLVGEKNEMTISYNVCKDLSYRVKKNKTKQKKQREQCRKKNFGAFFFFFIQNTVHITKVLEFSGICYKFKTNLWISIIFCCCCLFHFVLRGIFFRFYLLDLESVSQIIRFYVCNLFCCLFFCIVYFTYFDFFIFLRFRLT